MPRRFRASHGRASVTVWGVSSGWSCDRPSHGFSGWYLEGTDIWVEFAAVPEGFSHWSVNGRRVPYHSVLHRVRRDVVIRAEVGAA